MSRVFCPDLVRTNTSTSVWSWDLAVQGPACVHGEGIFLCAWLMFVWKAAAQLQTQPSCRNLCRGLALGQRCQQIHLLPPGWLCPVPPSPESFSTAELRRAWQMCRTSGLGEHSGIMDELREVSPGIFDQAKTPITDRFHRNTELSLTRKVAFKTFSSSQVSLTGVPNLGTAQGL